MGALTTVNTLLLIWSIIATHARTQSTMSPDQLLWEASSRGDLDEVKTLVGDTCTDADVNYQRGYFHVAPLHIAAHNNRTKIVPFLLSCNVTEINIKTKDGYTALMLASNYSYPVILKSLITAGAEVDLTDDWRKTALMLASMTNNNLHSLHALIKAGAEVDLKDDYDQTALMLASWFNNNPAIIQALITAGAEVNLLDYRDNTALMMASYINDNPNITKALLLAGAEINLKGEYGRTALHFATYNCHIEQVKVLLHHCDNATSITEFEWTAAYTNCDGRMDILQMIEQYIETNNCTAPETHNWIDDTIVTPGTNNYIDATPEYDNTTVASLQPLRVLMSFIRDILDSMIAG